ncbi:hypothetical protein [Pallidibacillus pasinlerensis]|uniref:DUF1146 domain-containing protein n=1 Tax=Pallidibacillus pasinlerensis TaxID=2703818 RepID=A0ABX0A5H5_9BACI|nr:hypothetical protein [Pallidibacillus pasinlerensis]NCU18693.1 hypothetical protein [Pallidibacillus pasinlerensis]
MLLLNFFIVLIIFITVFALIKVYNIAYKRDEISKRKLQTYSAITIVAGIGVTTFFITLFNELYDLLML